MISDLICGRLVGIFTLLSSIAPLCLHSGRSLFATFGSLLFKFRHILLFSQLQTIIIHPSTLSSLRSRPFCHFWLSAIQIWPTFDFFRISSHFLCLIPLCLHSGRTHFSTFGSQPFCHSHFFLKAPEALSGAQCRRKERRGGVRSELELLRAEPRSAIARAGANVPP